MESRESLLLSDIGNTFVYILELHTNGMLHIANKKNAKRREMMDSNEYELYEAAVNLQWLKLSGATTPEEIREVLDTWPTQEEFCKEEKEENVEIQSEI